MRFAPGTGTAVANLTLAVDRRIKKEGQPEADFINCVAFGKTAEIMAQYLSKGRLVGVSGRIQCGSYEAKDGTKRYTTDIMIDEFQFLEKGSGSKPAATGGEGGFDDNMEPIDDNSIPF